MNLEFSRDWSLILIIEIWKKQLKIGQIIWFLSKGLRIRELQAMVIIIIGVLKNGLPIWEFLFSKKQAERMLFLRVLDIDHIVVRQEIVLKNLLVQQGRFLILLYQKGNEGFIIKPWLCLILGRWDWDSSSIRRRNMFIP